MLNQNTDRMWYLIGAVFAVVVAVIFVNNEYPEIFAGAMSGFKDEAMVEVVHADPDVSEVEIPYDITYTTNPSEVREGVNGIRRIYSDDTPDEIVLEPIDRVVLYPYEEGDVPFSTVYVDNKDKPVGWSEVIQEGKNGSKFGFYDPHTLEGVGEYVDMFIPAIPKKISRGVAPILDVPYGTQYSLTSSDHRNGVVGKKYIDSKGKSHILENPVDEIVAYPTRTESFAHGYDRKPNHDWDVGREQITTHGVRGQNRVHYDPRTNQAVKTVKIKDPVTQITSYGTRKTESVAFGTSYTTDKSKVKAGVKGKKYVYADGRKDHVFQQPVNEMKLYSSRIESISHGTTWVTNLAERKAVNVNSTSTKTSGVNGQVEIFFHPTTKKEVSRKTILSPKNAVRIKGNGYTIKSGDTLANMSRRFLPNLNEYTDGPKKIRAWNPGLPGDTLLQIGTRIRIAE